MPIELTIAIAGVAFLIVVGIVAMIFRFYRKVDQGQALIVNRTKGKVDVTFTGAVVYPIVNRAEIMDISLKAIELARRGSEGLICKDNLRADITVTFFVRVNKKVEDVLQVAQSIGCVRASDQATVEDLFMAKFSEALKTAGKQFEFAQLYEQRAEFKDAILRVIGEDLNGYVLEDAAIDYLEQTPLESLDKDNILDADGIKKITKLTTEQNILTNEFKQEERKKITAKNVEADEAVFELEKQRADAEAKQKREIATIRAREEAEVLKVQAEERSRAEQSRIKAEEEISIHDENRQREVEVAKKNRERVVAVEIERVEKERALEAIIREREVELSRISKEKELEVQKKEIADVISARISVEKNVAVEEELIKDLRATKDATRRKDVMIIQAEAEAEEKLVRDKKAAEAAEEVAKFNAREVVTRAKAADEAAELEAHAKIRMAEGVQAEEAASGLATVKVKEADALAVEKLGKAEAKVTLEKMQAEAEGSEKKGMATVRVKEAEAAVIEKTGAAEAAVVKSKLLADAEGNKEKGLAEAMVVKEKLLSEAEGEREKGLAKVRVKDADAAATEKMLLAEATGVREKGLADATVQEAVAAAVEKRGMAEATAVREKLVAEANGLHKKAEAMKELDGVGREHEEFRLRLAKDQEVELAAIEIQKDVATAQATVLREAFRAARVQIIGGDGDFFDRYVRAASVGKSIDAGVESSESVQAVLKDYLKGDRSLPADVKEVLSSISSDSVQKLSISALLAKLAAGADSDVKEKLATLAKRAKDLGIDALGE